jgi:transglutaminase-like putative cysteine protease
MPSKKYLYSLRTDLVFSEPVRRHTFLLKAVPMYEGGQEPMRTSLTCQPKAPLAGFRDYAGNIVHQGYIEAPHDTFVFCSTGEVVVDGRPVPAKEAAPYFAAPSRLTRLEGELASYFNEHRTEGSAENIASDWMQRLSADLHYERGHTTTRTTASEAWALGFGVCQDYAHIMLALLRAQGIPCRYIAGLMAGEGESHAWVEYYDGKAWVGIDPTHNCAAGIGYVKISQGIDFETCALEKGVFIGGATQSVTSRCALIEI